MPINESILIDELQVINIGAKDFAIELAKQDVPVVILNWRPPLENDGLASILDDLL